MCTVPVESDDDDDDVINQTICIMQEDPTGQKYGRLEEEGGMGPDKVDSQLIQNHPIYNFHLYSC